MNINDYVQSILIKTGLPVARHKITTNESKYITWFIYETEYSKCDDKQTIKSYTIQIDLWSKSGEYLEEENKVKELMIKALFYLENEDDLYEADTDIYHKGMHFILENLEEIN
jgi:hypothetical protein